jgi:zinc transporter ZupT
MIAEAFLLGAFAQISLLLAGLAATVINVPTKVVGALAGFGAGAMISAVAFDLVGQAEVLGPWWLSAWLLVGAIVFIVGDKLVEPWRRPSTSTEPGGVAAGWGSSGRWSCLPAGRPQRSVRAPRSSAQESRAMRWRPSPPAGCWR